MSTKKQLYGASAYYSDVTPGVTSGTEGFSGGGWASSRQTSILLNPTVGSYGRSKKSRAWNDGHGRIITKKD